VAKRARFDAPVVDPASITYVTIGSPSAGALQVEVSEPKKVPVAIKPIGTPTAVTADTAASWVRPMATPLKQRGSAAPDRQRPKSAAPSSAVTPSCPNDAGVPGLFGTDVVREMDGARVFGFEPPHPIVRPSASTAQSRRLMSEIKILKGLGDQISSVTRQTAAWRRREECLRPIEFGEARLNLGREHKALDGVVNGGIRRPFPPGLDHPVARICCRHFSCDCSADCFDALDFFFRLVSLHPSAQR
jgi:hypothetical protein